MNKIALTSLSSSPGQLANLKASGAVAEEQIWLASQKSARIRRAYKLDVAHLMKTLGTSMPEQLRLVDHRAVIAWERIMREEQNAAASTVRRRVGAIELVQAPNAAWGRLSQPGGRCGAA